MFDLINKYYYKLKKKKMILKYLGKLLYNII